VAARLSGEQAGPPGGMRVHPFEYAERPSLSGSSSRPNQCTQGTRMPRYGKYLVAAPSTCAGSSDPGAVADHQELLGTLPITPDRRPIQADRVAPSTLKVRLYPTSRSGLTRRAWSDRANRQRRRLGRLILHQLLGRQRNSALCAYRADLGSAWLCAAKISILQATYGLPHGNLP